MDEIQLKEILTSYRDAINALIERADAQDGMINAIREKAEGLEHLVFDEVINPAKEAMEQEVYNAGLEDFANRYGEKLGGYNDKLRAIEGEDFDIMKQAYDGYNSIEGEKPDEGLYIDELIKVVDAQIDDIRTKLGVSEDAEVAVKQDENGETTVEVDGEEVATDGEVTEEKPAEEEKVVEEKEVTDTEDETDPEELAELEKELLAYAK